MTVSAKPSPEVWDAVLAHRDRALRVARARCGSPDEAEECAQEALVRVAAMPALDLSRLGPLISTVVANLAIDGHRRRTRAAAAEIRLRHAALPVSGHDDDICDSLEGRWLGTRLAVLAAQDRRALELKAAGLSVGEIASAMGLSYKAAEHALGRARAGMRAVWRATAAVLGVLWGARGRLRPGAAAGAVALASLVLSIALGAAPPSQAGAGLSPAAPHRAVAASAATAARSSPVPRPRAAVETAGVRRSATASPRRRRVAAVPAVEAGGLGTTGVTVSERPRGETLQQVVERCLRHVTVDPYRVECDG